MKFRLLVIIAFSFLLTNCAAGTQNNPVGDWAGTLNLGGGQLRLIFHITEPEDGYEATIESVDQNNAMIPAEITVDGDALRFAVPLLNVVYTATLADDEIAGEFAQNGMQMPDFTITRNE